MDPATIAMAGLSGAASGASSYLDSRAKKKMAEKDAQEKRRRTFAELLNQALERSFKAGEGTRERAVDLSKARAAALQNVASQYVQTFR